MGIDCRFVSCVNGCKDTPARYSRAGILAYFKAELKNTVMWLLAREHFAPNGFLNRQLTPIAAHPTSTCEALIATAKRSLHNDTGVLLRQAAYILT